METFSALLSICAVNSPVRGIHRSPVNSPHKGQWRGALMFSLICVSINGWVNNRDAGDLRCYRAHYEVTVMDLRHHDPRSCDITVMLHNFFCDWFEIMCWMIDHTSVKMVVTSLIVRFMGPIWGPSGADRTQVGPMSLIPWTLLSGLFPHPGIHEILQIILPWLSWHPTGEYHPKWSDVIHNSYLFEYLC